jgi:hypothetical protein
MRARRGHSSLIGFVITAVIAVPSFALVVQNTMQHDQPTKMELTSATGAVSITNSLEGHAILTAPAMLPGTTTTGSVSLANTGDGDETLTLDSSAPADTPGPGGGRLSQRLRLRVEDVSQGGNAVVVYDGTLDGLHLADLGTLQKDERRTYRFVVTFPDGGANGADNAYQGSSATIGFDWTAGAAGPAEPPADAPLPQQIAGDAPSSYWPLDATQSEMTDAVGDHTGAWANSVTTAPDAPGGSQAASFNGIDGYGYVSSLAAPTQAYTLEAWVKPATTDDMVILEHGGAGALAIRAGHFAFREVDVTLHSSAAVVAGRWQHVVGTWDASSGKARLYVDGALSAEADAHTPPSGSSTFYIGRGTWQAGSEGSTRRTSAAASGVATSFFHGDMAHVAYFPSSLAPDRIAAHWNSAKPTATDTGGATNGGATTDGGSTGADPATGTTDPGTGTSTGTSTGTGTGPQTACPGNVDAQGGTDERAHRTAQAKARARARAKALARARARKVTKTHGTSRRKARGKTAAKAAKVAKPAVRSTCPGARAKPTAKRTSG